MVVSFIFLNLFIAIILEGFAAATTEQNMRINDDSILAFNNAWTKYDKKATGMIHTNDLKKVVLDLTVEELKRMDENNLDIKANILFNFH